MVLADLVQPVSGRRRALVLVLGVCLALWSAACEDSATGGSLARVDALGDDVDAGGGADALEPDAVDPADSNVGVDDVQPDVAVDDVAVDVPPDGDFSDVVADVSPDVSADVQDPIDPLTERRCPQVQVTAPPAELGLDPFYAKYVDAGGLPLIGSAAVPDAAFRVLYYVVANMLRERPCERQALAASGVRFGIVALD